MLSLLLVGSLCETITVIATGFRKVAVSEPLTIKCPLRNTYLYVHNSNGYDVDFYLDDGKKVGSIDSSTRIIAFGGEYGYVKVVNNGASQDFTFSSLVYNNLALDQKCTHIYASNYPNDFFIVNSSNSNATADGIPCAWFASPNTLSGKVTSRGSSLVSIYYPGKYSPTEELSNTEDFEIAGDNILAVFTQKSNDNSNDASIHVSSPNKDPAYTYTKSNFEFSEDPLVIPNKDPEPFSPVDPGTGTSSESSSSSSSSSGSASSSGASSSEPSSEHSSALSASSGEQSGSSSAASSSGDGQGEGDAGKKVIVVVVPGWAVALIVIFAIGAAGCGVFAFLYFWGMKREEINTDTLIKEEII